MFSAGMDLADMAWEVKCREEDLAHRALENERRAIDDARRSVDEKSQQLKTIANQSALVAGFAMIVFVETNVPEELSPVLIVIFPITAALVAAVMFIAMLNATWTLVAILRYDCVNREVPFDEFWRKRCESDFIFALKSFSIGVPLFLCVLAELGWANYGRMGVTGIVSSSLISVIGVISLVFWFAHTDRKWSDFLMNSNAKLFDTKASQ